MDLHHLNANCYDPPLMRREFTVSPTTQSNAAAIAFSTILSIHSSLLPYPFELTHKYLASQ